MTEQERDLVEQVARFLDLSLDPAFLPGISANLALLQSHGAGLFALDLPPDHEPVPVFRP